jgi:hypothetical protein
MELPDFLTQYADPKYRDRVPQIRAVPKPLADRIDDLLTRKAHAPERVAAMVELGDELISGPKGYFALGAFNANERTKALDQLGFSRQLVFSTFAAAVAFDTRRPVDERFARGGASAFARARCGMGPASAVWWPLARPRGPRSGLGAAFGSTHSVHVARRRPSATGGSRLDEHRPSGADGLAGGR